MPKKQFFHDYETVADSFDVPKGTVFSFRGWKKVHGPDNKVVRLEPYWWEQERGFAGTWMDKRNVPVKSVGYEAVSDSRFFKQYKRPVNGKMMEKMFHDPVEVLAHVRTQDELDNYVVPFEVRTTAIGGKVFEEIFESESFKKEFLELATRHFDKRRAELLGDFV